MNTVYFYDPEKAESGANEAVGRGLKWLDFNRSEKQEFSKLTSALHDQHLSDLINSTHPPYFEQTDDYEMIIFRSIDERTQFIEPRTRSIAFLIVEDTVISVHDDDDTTLNKIRERLSRKKRKVPADVLSLLHLLFNEIVDAFLNLREPLQQSVSVWQQRLLDPNDPFNDWLMIMQAKSSFGRLNTNIELQKDVLENWQETTRYAFNASLVIKFNDLYDHLGRIERLLNSIRADLDSLTQIYFASSGQKTNVNVQLLAVISAIFLPLNLIAGIFGMNFENIPLLKQPFGPYVVIALMLALSSFLLWWFKKKSWY